MLNSKIVETSFGTYTVSEMSNLHKARMRNNLRNADAMKLSDEEKTVADEWVFVAACCDPFIPFVQWRDLKAMESVPLLEAAEELNEEFGKYISEAKKN